MAHMWQSRVEIKHYFVAHFNRIITFEALYHSTFIMGGAHMRCVNLWIPYMFTQCIWVCATALRMWWCDWNTQRNNVRFLLGTATKM